MRTLSWWKPALMTAFAGLFVIAACTVGAREGRTAIQQAEPQVNKQDFFYKGSASCGGSGCHEYPPNSKEPYKSFFAKGFIKSDEYITWKNQDKHSRAFANLESPRGQQMAKLLGVDVTKAEGGCLGCHSSGDDLVKARAGNLFETADGVSCENCHGPSSKWVGEHTDSRFRDRTSEERAAMGMIDVRSPRKMAEQCLSCHVGEVDPKNGEGSQKLVTHEMYAAGHPPLPSIELGAFNDFMHPHWMLIGEKPNEKVKLIPGYEYKPGQKDRTKLTMIGAAVALKTSMRLLANEAPTVGSDKIPGHDWPDFARFDCWSCHHDLKRDSWRQVRGYKAAPGRPPVSEWPMTLVELGIDYLEKANATQGAKPLKADWEMYRKAFRDEATARPYGKKELSEAADHFATWADHLVARLSEVHYTEAVSLELLKKLSALAAGPRGEKDGSGKFFDYDEARQIAWALGIFIRDSGKSLSKRPEIEAVYKKIGEGLKLDLPSGQDREILNELGESLGKINNYEPADFLAHLKELDSLLNPDAK